MNAPATETTQHIGQSLAGFAEMILSAPAEGEQTAITDPDEYIRERRRLDAIETYRRICPPAYRETDWNHPALVPCAAQIERVINWKMAEKGLILAGRSGVGKTRSMWELFRRLSCENGIECVFYHATDWFNALQDRVNYGRDEASGWVNAVACRRVVFIDDFGQDALLTSRAEWAVGWFFRFLDLRVGKKLPVILSTNLGARDFGPDTSKGDPIVRRLLEVCEPVRF